MCRACGLPFIICCCRCKCTPFVPLFFQVGGPVSIAGAVEVVVAATGVVPARLRRLWAQKEDARREALAAAGLVADVPDFVHPLVRPRAVGAQRCSWGCSFFWFLLHFFFTRRLRSKCARLNVRVLVFHFFWPAPTRKM